MAVWAYLLAYSGMVILVSPAADSSLRWIFDAHFLLVEALGLAALIRFTALFPEPLRPGMLRDPRTLAPGLRAAQRFRIRLLGPAAPWVAGTAAAVLTIGVNAALGRSIQNAALLPLADLLRLGALTVVVLNLRRAFFSAPPAGRTRVTWVALGFTVLVGAVGLVLGGNVLTAVTGWAAPRLNWRPIILHLGVIGLLSGTAMGVTYAGRVDPAPLVRRVAVVLGMATVMLFLAAGLEMLLSGGVSALFVLPHGAGTLLAVVVMLVVYRRSQRPLEAFLSQTWADVRSTLGTEP
jgi:hypothetical protein